MSTLSLINNELETLPVNLHEQVLAYIEFLKYRSLVKKVEKLAIEMGGAQEPMEGDAALGQEESNIGKDSSLQSLKEKTEFIGRLQDALLRAKSGEPGVPQSVMQEKYRQWQSK